MSKYSEVMDFIDGCTSGFANYLLKELVMYCDVENYIYDNYIED